jgi:hypothetical protein
METLVQRAARAVVDGAIEALASEDKAARQRAEAAVGRVIDGTPQLGRDLVLARMQSALEADDPKAAKRLERFLPMLNDVDPEAYAAAKSAQDRVALVRTWRTGGDGDGTDRPRP